MSRIFLDTSAYSAFKRGHPQIRYRIREASQILLNAVVLGELRAGFLKGTRLAWNLTELDQFSRLSPGRRRSGGRGDPRSAME